MRCVARTSSSVTLEVPYEALRGLWRVDVLEVVGWLWESTWVPAPRAPIVTQRGVASDAERGSLPHHLLIPGLSADSEYSFRVVRESGDDLSCSCRTVSRPLSPATPVCVRRLPQALTVEFIAQSPPDRPVSICQVHFRADAFYSPWCEVQAETVGSTQGSGDASVWRATLEGLGAATDYVVRARAGNEVGWSAAFSELGKCRTSDVPAPPTNLQVSARHPGAVTVKFDIEDKEGAPTIDVEVEVAGLVQWNQANECTKDLVPCRRRSSTHWYNDHAYHAAGRGGPQVSSDPLRTGKLRIANLPLNEEAEKDVVLRLWAWNAVGRSKSPSSELVCQPSHRPLPAHGLKCVGRWTNGIAVQWCSRDPDGAPVTACSLEICMDNILEVWHPVPDDVIARFSPSRARASLLDGETSDLGHWHAVVHDLDPECSYILRAYVINEVGRSDIPAPFPCRTADRPMIRHPPRCSSISATSVTLEFKLACDPAQISCMEILTAVAVDLSTMLVWEPVIDSNVHLTCSRVKHKKRTSEQADGSVEDVEEGIVKCRAIVSGLTGNTPYSFRIWVCNDVGWSVSPSPTMDCCTSLIPEAPSGLDGYALGPHSLALCWKVPDPAGAHVIGGQVQVHENMIFSYWQMLPADALRDGLKDPCWRQVVHRLTPGSEYSLQARAWNASGWSEWSESIACSTPAAPEIGKVLVQNIGNCYDRPMSWRAGKRRVSLSFEVVDHSAAPAVICMVTCCTDGQEVLACRTDGTRWGVCFDYLPQTSSQFTRFEVRAANAIGWGATCELRLDENAETAGSKPKLSNASVRQTISEFVAVELVRSRDYQSVLELLVHSVDVDDEVPKSKRCMPQLRVIQSAVDYLEALDRLPQKSFTELAAWTSACKARMNKTRAKSDLSGEQPEQALEAFHLLVEGGYSLELMYVELLEPLWIQICDVSDASSRSCSPKIWEREAETWCSDFNQHLLGVWKSVCITSVQLFAAAIAEADLSAASAHVVHDLTSLMVLRDTADRKLQELHVALEDLKQETSPGAEVALSIYELHGASALNAMTDLAGLGRAYHVGVEVYWLEWSFGFCEEGTGVQAVHVGESTLGTLSRRIPLGRTPCTVEEFFGIMSNLRKAWPGNSYQLLRRNCGHFSADLVQQLRVGAVPDWVNSLATVGDQLTKWLRSDDDDALRHAHINVTSAVASDSQGEGIVHSESDVSESLPESCWERRYMMRRRAKAKSAQETLGLVS